MFEIQINSKYNKTLTLSRKRIPQNALSQSFIHRKDIQNNHIHYKPNTNHYIVYLQAKRMHIL
ncbi:hypothetical protein NV36_14330 [Dokdonia donghaensis DSW-1]|uniref:Uncharacterized protein n=1 Tax=Dokdonia donghaensis DSW-1 TaxID=1300343 RepID=A0A0A2GXC2_9FLAO|nr:hypothetical protein I597_1752 [Dokdonia donghaensis DSW-1]KGO07894.1 hypothetical protein NV36_14330 [Dokdonia donghaensis DSW-1]